MAEAEIQFPIPDGNNVTVITLPASALSLHDGQEIVYVELDQSLGNVESVIEKLQYKVNDVRPESQDSNEGQLVVVNNSKDMPKFELQHVTQFDVFQNVTLNSPAKRGRKRKTGDDLICDVCGKVFTQLKLLNQHKKHHSEARPHKCKVVECGMSFKTTGALDRHMRIHTNYRPYQCQYCEMRFTQTGARKNHELTHTGDKPHTCHICGAKFVQLGSLQNHLIVHTNDRNHECEECGATYKHRKALLRHMKVHNSTKDFQCPYCWRSYYESYDLKRHKKVCKFRNNPKQSNSNVNTITCDIENDGASSSETCDKSHDVKMLDLIDTSKIQDGYHGDTVDPSDSTLKPFSCKICGKEFITKAKVHQHMFRFHLKPICGYLCEICGDKFHKKNLLDNHVKVHCDNEPYICRQCDQHFLSVSELNQHMRTHFTVKQFSCQICKKSFKFEKSLYHHMFIHVSDSPFNCEYCGRPCSDKTTKIAHYKQHLHEISTKLDPGIKDDHKPAEGIKYIYTTLKNENSLLKDSEYQLKKELMGKTTNNETLESMFKEIVSIIGPEKKVFNTPISMKDLPKLGFDVDVVNGVKRETKESIFKTKKRIKCTFPGCNKLFRGASSLSRHKLIHMKARPYKCRFCDRQFTQSGSCQVHERTHTGDKPFKCKECNAAFAQSGSLTQHLFRHSNSRNQTCSVCDAKFKVRKALLRHMKTHVCSKKFQCRHCKKEYLEKYDAKRHARKCKMNRNNKEELSVDKDLIEIAVVNEQKTIELERNINVCASDSKECNSFKINGFEGASNSSDELKKSQSVNDLMGNITTNDLTGHITTNDLTWNITTKEPTGSISLSEENNKSSKPKGSNSVIEHIGDNSAKGNNSDNELKGSTYFNELKGSNSGSDHDCNNAANELKRSSNNPVCKLEQNNCDDDHKGNNCFGETPIMKSQADKTNTSRNVEEIVRSSRSCRKRTLKASHSDSDGKKAQSDGVKVVTQDGVLFKKEDDVPLNDEINSSSSPLVKYSEISEVTDYYNSINQKCTTIIDKSVSESSYQGTRRRRGRCYTCSKCKREFFLENLRNDHESKCKGQVTKCKSQNLIKPCASEQCKVCGKQLSTSTSQQSQQKNRDLTKCTSCTETSRTKGAKISREGDKETFSCLFCLRRFSSLQDLKAHDSSHSENDEYGCVLCDSVPVFHGKANYLYHIDHRHPLKRPFRCSECMAGFTRHTEAEDHKVTSGCNGSVLKLSTVH